MGSHLLVSDLLGSLTRAPLGRRLRHFRLPPRAPPPQKEHLREIVGVTSTDVELLVYELQLKLMLREISFERILDFFQAKCDSDLRISLKGEFL